MKTMEHIYFVNAHPDDLSAVMGTALKLSRKKNCRLHVVDLTHGERALVGKIAPEECAKMRSAEESEVCRKLGADIVWLDEADGAAFASESGCRKLAELYLAEPPRTIITQWPLDRHLDHTAAADTALQALRIASGLSEGQMTGSWPEVLFYHYLRNSMADCPNCFVPLSEEEMKRKEEMIGLYRSQSPAWLFREEKETNIFYGRKLGVPYAEALTRLQPLPPGSPSILETLEP